MKTLHILDGSSFVYRSFFALPELKTSQGFPTNAVYGMLRAVLSIIKSEKPEHFVVVFDPPSPPKKAEHFKDYKAGRPSTPDSLKVQIPVIKKLLKLMGVPILELEGYEADDVIATLTERFSELCFQVKIYTPDKDMLQLVKEKVRVINPISWEVFDPDRVRDKFGVLPERVADFLSLVGDKIDNVPGIRGVGPKTAVKIIEKYGGVEDILSNFDSFKREFPQAERENLESSYKLINLIRDVELDLSEKDLRLGAPKLDELKETLKELEIRSISKDIEKTLKVVSQRSLF